jgi:hypothetical protein
LRTLGRDATFITGFKELVCSVLNSYGATHVKFLRLKCNNETRRNIHHWFQKETKKSPAEARLNEWPPKGPVGLAVV